LTLGGKLEQEYKGKLHVMDHANLVPTDPANLFDVTEKGIAIDKRNHRDYPTHDLNQELRLKGGRRVSPELSKTDDGRYSSFKKTSLVNQSSLMKGKNNAQYIQKIIQEDGGSEKKF